MTSLLSRAQSPNSEGRIQNITPESADWKYVGFDFFKLKAGQTLKKETSGREVCLVLVTGKASVKTLHESWDNLGERMSIFSENFPFPPNTISNISIIGSTCSAI